MRKKMYICAALIALGVGASAYGEEDPVTTATPAGTASVEQFSKASQAMYRKISASLVRVRIDQGFQSMLTGPQRKEFMDWIKAQPADAPATQPDSADGAGTVREQRRAARIDKLNGSTTQPAATVSTQRPMLALFRRFLDQKLKDPNVNQDALAKWRLIQNHLQQPIAETTALVVDNQGHAIILGTWVKDGAQPLSLRVIAGDGSESNAKYLGGHSARGLAVIKLDSPGIAPGLLFADGPPAPGELLMCLAANSGAIGFIASPGQSQKKNGEQRFPIYGNEEHGPSFLFNTSGQIAALGADRFALPISFLKRDIGWIIENKKDVSPRQLGVKYSPVSPALRKAARLLANRPAVVVDDVAAGSPAEKAGLQKNDIVLTIDRKPIWQMPQIQWDIATETAPVPVGILRDNKEVTLNMPLD